MSKTHGCLRCAGHLPEKKSHVECCFWCAPRAVPLMRCALRAPPRVINWCWRATTRASWPSCRPCFAVGGGVGASGDLNIPEAPEPHRTFIENALAKARHASALSGLPAMADDAPLVLWMRLAGCRVWTQRTTAPSLATTKAIPTMCALCWNSCRARPTAGRPWSALWWRCAAQTIPEPFGGQRACGRCDHHRAAGQQRLWL